MQVILLFPLNRPSYSSLIVHCTPLTDKLNYFMFTLYTYEHTFMKNVSMRFTLNELWGP